MILPSIAVLVGLALLYFGAEWLVRGGVAVGVQLRIPVVIVGLTVVSIGTSAPELVVCVLAVLDGNSDLAVGNIMGSNLANIGLILGLTALVSPLGVARGVVRRDLPWMLAVTGVAFVLLLNEVIGRGEGLLLSALLLVYLGFLVRASRRGEALPVEGVPPVPNPTPAPKPGPERDLVRPGRGLLAGLGGRGVLLPVGLIVVGVLALAGGGRAVVMGATELALLFGVSQMVIGLSIVAIGTSLPELATTLVAAVRGQSDLAIGNIVGSNIFNLTFVLGGTALVHPITVHPGVTSAELPALLAMSLLLVPFIALGRNVTRWEGVLLLLAYLAAWGWMLPAVG